MQVRFRGPGFAPCWRVTARKTDVAAHKPDVLVIGAGAAGLAAADALSRAGARVLLVEARRRIGGRIWTVRDRRWKLPLELGAEFVHGRAVETFRIADEAGLVVDRLPDLHWKVTRAGLSPIPELWNRVDRVMRRMKRGGRDRSVAEFLARRKLPADLRSLAVSIVEGYHAAHLDRVSERFLSTAGKGRAKAEEHAQFRIVSGYAGIVEFLRARAADRGVSFRLGAPVAKVRWKRGAVSVSTVGGAEIRAARALVTVPLGVLQAPGGSAGAIRFEPPLAEKQTALSRLEMGHVARLVFLFRDRFWQAKGFIERRVARTPPDAARDLGFVYSPDAAVPVWWTAAPAQAPMMVGWAGGPAAERLLGSSRGRILRTALTALGELLGVPRRRLEDRLERWRLHDWSADPYSRGAYSYALVGAGPAHRVLARPLEETLFFAGEATEEEKSGTVEGALASGLRAARQILGM